MSRFHSISEYLSWDHDRLEGLLDEVRAAVNAADFPRARESYKSFEDGLRRHIRIEEEMLFPLFERKTGIVGGPTFVMREEHRSILESLNQMRTALEAARADGFRDGLHALEGVLPQHNVKEERVLYPMTDDALSDEERERVTADMIRA